MTKSKLDIRATGLSLVPGSINRRALEILREMEGKPASVADIERMLTMQDNGEVGAKPRDGSVSSALSRMHAAEYVERRAVWSSNTSQRHYEYRISPVGLSALRRPVINVGDWH